MSRVHVVDDGVTFSLRRFDNPYAATVDDMDLMVEAVARAGLSSHALLVDVGRQSHGVIGPTMTLLSDRFEKPPGAIVHAFDECTAFRGADLVHFHHVDPLSVSRNAYAIAERFRYLVGNRWVRGVTVWTQGVADDLRRQRLVPRSTPIYVIPHPHRPVPERSATKVYDVLWIGTDDWRKGFGTFVEALAETRVPLNVAVLKAPGKGGRVSYVDFADLFKATRFHLIDWLDWPMSRTRLDLLYRQSHTIVSTSVIEGYQNVIADGFLRGCRPLVPYQSPFFETYVGEPAASFYRPGDARALSFQLEKETHMGLRYGPSYNWVQEHSLEEVGRRLRVIYEALSMDDA